MQWRVNRCHPRSCCHCEQGSDSYAGRITDTVSVRLLKCNIENLTSSGSRALHGTQRLAHKHIALACRGQADDSMRPNPKSPGAAGVGAGASGGSATKPLSAERNSPPARAAHCRTLRRRTGCISSACGKMHFIIVVEFMLGKLASNQT